MIQEKLIKFPTRLPVFMYLTDYREFSLVDVITALEPSLFRKVTGLTVKDFERLISDEANIDRQGLIFKPNQQLRVREFLDENVFSDAMLNMPENTVKSHIRRGKEKLTTYLKQNGYG